MVKTTKGGKTMNPTDAYRKELRKKELKRNKKERKKVREVGLLKKDPDSLRQQIQKLEAMKAEGPLDKARKHKKRQLEDTLNLVIKKRKEYEDKMKEKGEAPVMFSHLGPVRRRASAEEEERVKHPRPEDSVYYHPTLNPSGAPPPGKPPMFKSSIGPRIPLSEASTSNTASDSKTEEDDENLPMPPLPPPPPPPLPGAALDPGSSSGLPVSLPLPPPPPMPPKPAVTDATVSLPPPPPPPPGPPPKEILSVHPPLPPPSSITQSTQPTSLGTDGSEKPAKSEDDSASRDSVQMPLPNNLPPPPPPTSMPPELSSNQPEGLSSNSDTKLPIDAQDLLKLAPPPPPLPVRQQPPMPGVVVGANVRPDVLPPGISHFPPPPPPMEMRPPLPPTGIPGQPLPAGVMVPLLPRPPFGPPPGHPSMMRPPLPPGPPPMLQDDFTARPTVPQKPSYVKSAASTVVKRPLAQHTPELTAMVPASVRVKRESALPKPKPKTSSGLPTNPPAPPRPVAKQESTSSSSSALKPQSIDDSYTAFLEDMKALGALDS
ncbi:protein EARLY FLOWERING 5 [Andrographis paniculata]|uniref:protein EARLY FLOWERING 5 n=1 Tax=Andrographis paniculata TaxID=175694 RepID=UPI0021E7397F|nr:protein EARLY FLOWERING 5 [Andrographis paniculata]